MQITGRLTKDAEVRTTAKDKQVVVFSLVENDTYKNKQGELIVQTTFFECSYWLGTNVSKILTKGTLVELWGRVEPKMWTDREGNVRQGLNFHTSRIKYHGGGRKAETAQATAPSQNNGFAGEQAEDDLPF